MWFIPVMENATFHNPFIQFSVSRHNSEIILICWFGVQLKKIYIVNVENSCAA